MVVTIAGVTIVQVPFLIVGKTKVELKRLAEDCYQYGRIYLNTPCKRATIDRSMWPVWCTEVITLMPGVTLSG